LAVSVTSISDNTPRIISDSLAPRRDAQKLQQKHQQADDQPEVERRQQPSAVEYRHLDCVLNTVTWDELRGGGVGDEGRDGFCSKIIRRVSDTMSQNVEQHFI
jgi:hypothetical protein